MPKLTPHRFLVALVAFAALIVVVGGLPLLLWTTAKPLHPDPQNVPSSVRAEPLPQWAAAVGRARQVVRATVSGDNLPGLSVAVGVGGEIVWAEGFGWADIETHAPVTPNTRFRIGTASTALTAAAVGVLLQKDRVTLDAEIQTYVPQFPRQASPVTLRDLMADTSGVGIATADDWQLSSQRCERAADALPAIADTPLLFEPGTQSRPSPRGWVLVSAAVEAAGDWPFFSFMRDQVFQPLGMANTGAESAAEENPERIGEDAEDPPPLRGIREVILEPWRVIAGRQAEFAKSESWRPATFYVPEFGPHPVYQYGLRAAGLRNLSCYAGAMAFFSTPSDLARFELGVKGGKLLRPAAMQSVEPFGRTTNGYDGHLLGIRGVFDSELPSATVVSVVTVPQRALVVVVMSNITSADTSTAARKIVEAFGR